MLVAMKGHPGCGKSTVARSLGRALQWPVLDKDDIRDCTRALSLELGGGYEEALNSMAYKVLWRLAETQLQMGLSVIVDCPLSSPSLFDSASALATRYHKRLVIIECLPSDVHLWKARLESRAASDANSAARYPEGASSGWHKPACWEELQALIDKYEGRWDYETASAKKLTLDTTAPALWGDALFLVVLRWLQAVDDDTPAASHLP